MMNGTKRLRIVLLAAALLSAQGCAGTRSEESTGEFIDDTAITTKVKAAFVNDPMVKVWDVNVETFKGVVQLSGDVTSKRAMDQAVQLARNVPGVRSVKNEIRVR